MIRDYIYWIAAALLLLVPAASGHIDKYEADSQATGIQAIVMHQYPSHTIPIGQSFYASVLASGSQDTSDDFGYGAITATGCTVLSSAIQSGTTATKGLWLHIQQDGPVCSWWFNVTITDTGIGGGTAAKFRVTGSTAATGNVELTDGGSYGGVAFWVPVLVFVGIFLWGGYTGQSMVTFAGLVGVAASFIEGAAAWLPFVVLLALIAAYIPSIAETWARLKK